MMPPLRFFLLALVLCLPETIAVAQCRLCAPEPQARTETRTEAPLRITISANLEFNTVASGEGGGEVQLDPVSGQRRLSGNLVDLGGFALRGSVQLSGEPGRTVNIILPSRIVLSSPDGGTAEVLGLETDLNQRPRLDQNGRLSFSFGGRLRVNGHSSGKFKGRIPITADYD